MRIIDKNKDFSDKYLLLQVGYSNWLILTKYKNTTPNICNELICSEYSLGLVEYWKDYNYFNKLHFGTVKKDYSVEFMFSKKFDWKSKLVDDIKHGNYEYVRDFTIDTWKRIENINLIFRNTKIPSIVKAEDLYNAFDEYYSHLKDDVNVDNMTDIEKVESHGFNKKTSFRGK